MVWIGEWDWDDGNLDELARHGLDWYVVLQVAEGHPKFRANRKQRAASHQMIGPDRGGRYWTVCIVRLAGERWRAVTGWTSSTRERAWYEGA
jgi:uncharacterized DUF497 family protein